MTLINDTYSSKDAPVGDLSQSQLDALPGNETNLRRVDEQHAPYGPANDGHHHEVTSRETWDAARAQMMTKGID